MRRLLDRKMLEHNNVWGNKLIDIGEFPGIIGDIPSEPFEVRSDLLCDLTRPSHFNLSKVMTRLAATSS
jgi:hypothetical protein